MIVFDIETGPLPESEIRQFMAPEEPPYDSARVPPFDPASVKYGNLKDPAKRAVKLEECRQQHAEENSEQAYEAGRAARRKKYEAEFIDKAALNATTCRILAIGYKPEGCPAFVKHGDGSHEAECDLLDHFWKVVPHVVQKNGKLVGHNSNGFDLPVIIRRSWLHRIAPTVELLDARRYYKPWCVDLMEIWQAGCRGTYTSLETVSKFFGNGTKNGDGAMFSKLFLSGDPVLRQQALDYAANDVEMTYRNAVRMGVLRDVETETND